MVQGYTRQDSGSKGGWHSLFCPSTGEKGRSPSGTFKGENVILRSYTCGVAHDEWVAYFPKEPRLLGPEAADREVGGPMLSVTGINRFFYLCDFTDMRYKHSRVLPFIREPFIREPLLREPNDGDVFIS